MADQGSARFVEDTELWILVEEAHWDAVTAKLRTKAGKEEAKKRSRQGGFLCHQDHFLKNAPFACVHELGKVHPEAFTKARRTFGGMEQYPLHIAARIENPRDHTLVYHMYHMAPASVTERDEDGLLPLHVACESNNMNAIEIMLHLHKVGACDCENEMQNFPLHYACTGHACTQ
jgi:hypothetical protein